MNRRSKRDPKSDRRATWRTAEDTRRPRARHLALLAASLLLAAGRSAPASVFDGDPVDPSTGLPWVLLPGVPLVHPGGDERYGDGDDVFDTGLVGDVDLVLRSGDTYEGGTFPPPASGIATAPLVRAGGSALGGTEVVFDVVASDGAASPPAGAPLLETELDGRAALVFAYADLDGDGWIGPTSADGGLDDEIERQEVLSFVGRQVAVFLGGVAHGSLGVSLGAPASAGGIGIVIVAGAATGALPPVFTDGPWASTLLPFMPSTDPDRILHGNPRAADPDYLSVIEIEMGSDRHFVPHADHPVIGTPFAIPLDGSSPSVDLARAEGGAAVGVALGVPIDAATYVAAPERRLLPAVAPDGATRALVDASRPLPLADDGPGGSVTILAFAADRVGSPTNPGSPIAGVVEAGPGLRIVSPDTDGDPAREPIALASAASVALVIDDAGGAGDAPAASRVVVAVAGVPTAALEVDLPEGAPRSWTRLFATFRLGARPERGTLRLTGAFVDDPDAVDPAAQDVGVTVSADELVYAGSLAAGAFTPSRSGDRFSYRDPKGSASPRIATFQIQRQARDPTSHSVKLLVRDLDLSGFDPRTNALVVTLRSGVLEWTASLDCAANAKETATLCTLR